MHHKGDLHIHFGHIATESSESRGGSGAFLAENGAFHDFVALFAALPGTKELEQDAAFQYAPPQETNPRFHSSLMLTAAWESITVSYGFDSGNGTTPE